MIKKSFFNLSPILSTLLFLLSQQCLAEEKLLRLYNFELIVFKYKNLDYFQSETWDKEWKNIDTSSSLDFQYPNKQASVRPPTLTDKTQIKMAKLFKPLTAEQKTLNETVQAVNDSSRYELLAYHTWQQPGLDSETAIPVRIRSLNSFRHLEPITTNIMLNDEIGSNNIRNEINDHYELDGTVKIVLSRFLHIHLDLRLLLPVTLESFDQPEEATQYQILLSNEENPDAKLFGINFRDHRRMRSNELHHIDHPLLGVIVLAKPVKSN